MRASNPATRDAANVIQFDKLGGGQRWTLDDAGAQPSESQSMTHLIGTSLRCRLDEKAQVVSEAGSELAVQHIGSDGTLECSSRRFMAPWIPVRHEVDEGRVALVLIDAEQA
jgi:hypothetical protein